MRGRDIDFDVAKVDGREWGSVRISVEFLARGQLVLDSRELLLKALDLGERDGQLVGLGAESARVRVRLVLTRAVGHKMTDTAPGAM